MGTGADDFRARLRTVLTGAADTPLVLVGNFEVEERWGRGEIGLPRLGGAGGAGGSAARRMDELALLIADDRDVVLLGDRPDPGFLEHLAALGLGAPRIVTPRQTQPGHTATADALADPELLAALGRLASEGYRLAPHGVSDQEEELSRRTGLRLAGPRAAICKRVNSKIYSRELAIGLGLRQPEGWACRTLTDLADAFAWARGLVADGRRVVVKDAFGVSGKGLLVVADDRRFDQLWRLISAEAARAGHDRIALVVEEWIGRRMDLNYQFTVERTGAARLDFVKEALTENGVHRGHRFPVALAGGHSALIADTARALARRLAKDGYVGVAGVDAMVGESGELYPVVEINARNNMSTYQSVLHERFAGPGRVALARHFALRPSRPLAFCGLHDLLGDTLLRPGARTGMAVTAFATVNAAGSGGEGRLYSLLIADSPSELSALEDRVSTRLPVPILEGTAR